METAVPGRSCPVKQGSHMPLRARWTAGWLFRSLPLLYSSLSMMFMSKAATAIHGNCIQHPSQICIFPSRCTWCHVCLNTHVRFMSHFWRQRSSPAHALRPHLISITYSSCRLTASPPFPNDITSPVQRTPTPYSTAVISPTLTATTILPALRFFHCFGLFSWDFSIVNELTFPAISKKSNYIVLAHKSHWIFASLKKCLHSLIYAPPLPHKAMESKQSF